MASLADEMAIHDAIIFDAIGDILTFGSDTVKGIFFKRYRQIELQDGAIMALDISFDCQTTDHAWVMALEEGDEVEIGGNTYLFGRHIPQGADESGLVVLELKESPGA